MIEEAYDKIITHTNIKKEKKSGKVRDIYTKDEKIILISTDRLSGFDRYLTSVPYKGEVLTQTSIWWFNKTKHIVPNYILDNPHPNVIVGKKCDVFPIEFVMRRYLTGSTNTSIWTHYKKGCREYCGFKIKDGMKKNEKLEDLILTPTTKSDVHDELLSINDIVDKGYMSKEDCDQCIKYSYDLFRYSEKEVEKRGLILVDTKYEFGKDNTGNILLIDEIQTPDSSRYWKLDNYETRMLENKEPDNIDKEFLRMWYKTKCDPYKDKNLPMIPRELTTELSNRYISLYETITGNKFKYNSYNIPLDNIKI